MKQYYTGLKAFSLAFVLFLLNSCGKSVTNVWDFYIKNNVEVHKLDSITSSKSIVLYRERERVSKSQLEMIAYMQDSIKYLVFGSHKVAKDFTFNDNRYSFDVTDLSSQAKGKDFIRQLRDLSIYFTHIPSSSCRKFLESLPDIKATYKALKPGKGQRMYVDYALSTDVVLSFPKDGNSKAPSKCTIWVGKRKHIIAVSDLIKVMSKLNTFE